MPKKIKSKTTTRYNYAYHQEKEEWLVTEQYVTAMETHDKEGHLLSERTFNRDGENDEHNEYRYNAQGQLIEELIYFENEAPAESRTFEYREDGKLILETIKYQDANFDKVHYSYDATGNLIERRQVDEEEEVESLEQYVYEDGLLRKESIFGSGQEFISEAIHSYNEEKKLTETLTRGAEAQEVLRLIYEYDEKGNRDCAESYSKDGQIMARTTFTHDEKNNVIEMFEEDTSTSKTTRFSFDERDNIVLQEEYNEKEELNHRIERIWDEDDELIESIIYIDRHDQGPDQYYSVKQEFEYYD